MKASVPSMRWVELGDYIDPCDERNADGRFGVDAVRGINKNKEFMPTAANVESVDLRKYMVVRKSTFAFSGMQTGRDVCIRIALQESPETFVISPAYQTFRIKPCAPLLPQFLLMYFKRAEMDRYGWFLSDSSVRSNLDWSRFVHIRIPLPSIEEQRRIVAAWRGLRNIREQNESLAEPLLALCQSRMEDLKKRATADDGSVDWVLLGDYIDSCDERNDDGSFGMDDVRGISIEKRIIPTKADMTNVSLTPYKIVRQKEFCFVTVTSRNGEKISLAENDSGTDCIVSSSYEVFRTHPDELDPSYLYLWFCRPEFDRYTRFHSWGSARETFSIDDMKRVRIPLPRIEEQKRIVAVYEAAREAKRIAEEAGRLSESICPALMRRAAEGAS